MTPEQVSALSNAELERAMIWLYPPDDFVIYNGAIDMYLARYRAMNYLASYDLTMQLVIEKGVTVIKEEDGRFWAGTDIDAGGFIHMNYDATAETYLRAACECLVLTAMSEANG